MKKNKLKTTIIYTLIITIFLTSCSSKNSTMPNSEMEKESYIQVVDQIGRQVNLEQKPTRIISSSQVSTSIILALDREERLVGLEKGAASNKFYKRLSSNLLDLPTIGSGKGINIEEVAMLKPDLVILPKSLKNNIEMLEAIKIPVIIINPTSQKSLLEAIKIIATVTDSRDRARELEAYYEEKTKDIKEITQGLEKKKVYLSSPRSYYNTLTSNMYQNELIEMIGAENVSGGLKQDSWRNISAEQLIEWNPDYFFFSNDSAYRQKDILNDPSLRSVKAIKNGHVYRFPSLIEAWDKPVPASILSLAYLSYILYPEKYSRQEYIEEVKYFYEKFYGIELTYKEMGL